MLSKLLCGFEYEVISNSADVRINKINYDSRKVGTGDVFVCIDGFSTDGHNFAQNAIKRGAKALIVQKELQGIPADIVIIKVKETRKALAHIASVYYNYPAKRFNLIGVTGTNGKTTTTYMIEEILKSVGQKVGVMTNKICERTNKCFETQTVRIKANEYVKEGILVSCKKGKALYYELSQDYLYKIDKDNREDLLDAIKYYQGVAPFGVVGNYLLDNENEKNDIFTFKHNFIVHTLEDRILLELLRGIKEKKYVGFVNQSVRTKSTSKLKGVPVKIFVSSQSGRRYVAIYNEWRKRFINHRLDCIKSVKVLEECEHYDSVKENLEKNLDKCWGVSFGGTNRKEQLFLKLFINEECEMHILKRLEREGKGGEIIRIDKNIYLYSKDTFDVNEMMPWVKTFIGRIISFECTNKFVYNKFYNDMKRMH